MITWFSKTVRFLVVSVIMGILTGAAVFLLSLHRYPQWWQHQLLSFVQQTVQQPVQVESMRFLWQDFHLHVLVDHVVIGQEHPIRIQHVDVQWMWRSILLLSPRFAILVHGVVVPVVHLQNGPPTIGPWQLSDSRAAAPLSMRGLLFLVHQPSIRIEEMQWQLYDQQATVPRIIGPMLFTSVHTLASEMNLVASLPSGHSATVHVHLHSWDPYLPIGFDHAIVDISLDRCNLALWQHVLWPSTTTPIVQVGQGSLQVSLHIKQGFLSEMFLTLALQNVLLRNPTVGLADVRMQAVLESEHHLHERSYRVRVHRFSYQVTHHPVVVMQDAQIEGLFNTANHVWEKCIVHLQQLPVEQLDSLLEQWPAWQRSWYSQLHVAGTLASVTVEYQPGKPQAWFTDVLFHNLSWRPYRSVPGFSGVSGTVTGNGTSGQLIITSPNLSVWAPTIFDDPFHQVQLNAKCFWYHAAHNGVDCSWIHWQDHDVKMSLLGQYTHHGQHATIVVHIPRFPIARLQHYIPMMIAPSVRRWFLTALQGEGTFSPLHLMMEIPLADRQARVQWSLSTVAHNATVAYHPRWPKITDVQGTLTVRHHMLRFLGSGRCENNALQEVTVSLPTQAAVPTVSVTGRVEGPLAHYVAFIHHSPLRETLGTVLAPSHTHATGSMTLPFLIRVPLVTDRPTTFVGQMHFLDNTLSVWDGLIPCEHIQGTVDMDIPRLGITKWHLQALCWQKVLQARTAWSGKTYSRLLLKGFVNTQALASRFFTQPDVISGILPWSAVLESRVDATLLMGLVQGQSLRVQALPVTKQETTQKWPLSFLWQHTPQLDRVRAQVACFWHAIWQRRHQQPWTMGMGIGEHVPAHLPEQGVQLDIQQPVIDVEPWLTFFRTARRLQTGGDVLDVFLPLRVYVYTPHLWYQSWALGANRFSIERFAAHDYHIAWMGPAIQGKMVVQGAPLSIAGHFQSVHVAKAKAAPTALPITPLAINTWLQQWPAIAIDVDSLQLGHTPWGHCQLIGQRESGLYWLRKVTCTEPTRGRFLIKNDPTDRNGQVYTTSTIEASTNTWDEITRSCPACSLPRITGGRTQLAAQLSWPGSAVLPPWSQLSGSAHLSIAQGSFPDIKPGMLRILGLTSFYSWAQRIMLKFQDVVLPGFAFQSIAATFHLQHGILSTTNAILYSYMLRVQGKARVVMANHGDIDAVLTVTPDLSGAIAVLPVVTSLSPWVAVLVGIQNVLHHSLDHLLNQQYHVTGFLSQWHITHVKK